MSEFVIVLGFVLFTGYLLLGEFLANWRRGDDDAE